MTPAKLQRNGAPGKGGGESDGNPARPMPANRIATQARVCAQLVLTTLAETLTQRHPADRMLRTMTTANRQLGARDRRIISETLFSTLRWWGWLRHLAPVQLTPLAEGDTPPPLHSSDWMGVFAAAWLLEGRFDPPPSVAFWMREAKVQPECFLGLPPDLDMASRRKLLRPFFQKQPMPALPMEALLPSWLPDAAMPLPEGHNYGELLEWSQRRAPVWIRAQTKDHAGFKGLVERESEQSVKLLPHPRLPNAFAIRNAGANLRALPSYQDGMFELQDLASQCVGAVCAPRPGERWWDSCAGGGGKSLHLGMLMENHGTILASDVRAGKLDDLKLRARRARLSNLRTMTWDGTAAPDTGATFDGVLVDAPCTCSGTWRRAPEARWNTIPQDLERFTALQRRLLNGAAAAVRPGGVLVYSTCSMLRAENQEAVTAFLEEHPDFALEPFENPLDGAMTDGTLQLWPWDGDCDAMFTAKFRRKV